MQAEAAIIVIPEEAEALIPLFREEPYPGIHLMTYAAPFTPRMMVFNSLDYYTLPPLPKDWKPPTWLVFEIGILAGRLYFDYTEYNFILDRLYGNMTDQPDGASSYSDSNNTDLSSSSPLRHPATRMKRQLNFLHEWLPIRRQGHDISHTPMGYVCQGRNLRADHPFFRMLNDSNDKVGKGREAGDINGSLFHSLDYGSKDEEEYYDSDDDDHDVQSLLEFGDENLEYDDHSYN